LQFVVANSFLIANIIKHLGVIDGDFAQICFGKVLLTIGFCKNKKILFRK